MPINNVSKHDRAIANKLVEMNPVSKLIYILPVDRDLDESPFFLSPLLSRNRIERNRGSINKSTGFNFRDRRRQRDESRVNDSLMESYLLLLYVGRFNKRCDHGTFHGIVSQSMHASASYLFINYFRLAQRSDRGGGNVFIRSNRPRPCNCDYIKGFQR